MRKLQNILLISVLGIFLSTNGQDLSILNTHNLKSITDQFGIDSALSLTNGIPIYYIDKLTAKELARRTLYCSPSNFVERYLVDYALHVDDDNLPILLYDYFNRKLAEIENYQSKTFGGLPRIFQDALFALIENPTAITDSLLIKYYIAWDNKSKEYYSDYLKGKSETDRRKKEKLMSPFEDCNYNCYVILLALDSLGSDFFDKERLEKHQSNLKSYWQDGFGIHKSGDFTKYKVNNPIKSINLNKNYNTIGEIDFDNEPDLIELFKRYDKTYCWKFIMYNENIGYLDLGCQSGPLAGYGVMYRLELKKNKLIIHEIQSWIS